MLTYYRFDDKDIRAEQTSIHALASIKEIWNLFIENYMQYYLASTNCMISEQLFGFRRHFGARVYIPSKSDNYNIIYNIKYSIKIVSLNDI